MARWSVRPSKRKPSASSVLRRAAPSRLVSTAQIRPISPTAPLRLTCKKQHQNALNALSRSERQQLCRSPRAIPAFTVTFIGTLAGIPQPILTASSALSPAGAALSIANSIVSARSPAAATGRHGNHRHHGGDQRRQHHPGDTVSGKGILTSQSGGHPTTLDLSGGGNIRCRLGGFSVPGTDYDRIN